MMKGKADPMLEREETIWRGEVTNELRHIAQSLRDVQRQVSELRVWIAEEREAHSAYHAANEHRWGIVKWCQMHPFRLAAILLAIATYALGKEASCLPALAKVIPEMLR